MAEAVIVSEVPMDAYQLKKELERIKKRDKELDFRAAKTEEYLNQVAPYSNADQLFDKLMKLEIPRLKEAHVHKIIDIMPSTAKDLKVILQGYTLTVNNDSIKKIVDAISEFIEKSEKK